MSEHANICPQCGAPAQAFAPEVQSIHCHFCNTPYAVRHPDYEKVRRQKEAEERARRDAEKKAEKQKEKTKGNAAGCAVPFVIVAIIGGTFGGTYWYEDIYKPRQWDGHHDFSCKSGTITFSDLQATGDVDARGTCVLNFVRPAFESHIKVREHAVVNITGGRVHDASGTVISVEGFAKVVLKDTTVDGSEAVRAKGSATVEFQNATVNGKVRADSPSELVGYTPPPASSSASTSPTVAPGFAKAPLALDKLACMGVPQCFQSWSGKFSGKLTITLDKTGSVKKTVVTGTQTPAIKTCLIDIGTKTTASLAASGMTAGAGDMSCTYSGTRDGFVTQLSSSGSWVPAPQ